MRPPRPALLALGLIAASASAQIAPPKPYLAEGEMIETQLTADLDGDGNPELVYIATKEESRALRVMFRSVGSDVVLKKISHLTLDPYPLGDGQLSVKDSAKGKVLIFQDLTGGITAVASTHRFRWDGKLGAMRLIGLDALLYSRTFAHDGLEASWNLLTGDLVTSTLRLVKDPGPAGKAYDTVSTKRRKRPSPPVRLEDSHSAETILPYPYGN